MSLAGASFADVTEYLLGFEKLYPGIASWSRKVGEEVLSSRRSVFAQFRDGAIAGLAITKNGFDAKLCHISVSNTARMSGLGSALMRASMEEMLRHGARRVHVTTGEEVAQDYGEFFARSGFALRSRRKDRYRRGADELEWFASGDELARIHALQRPADCSANAPVLWRLHPRGHDFVWMPYRSIAFDCISEPTKVWSTIMRVNSCNGTIPESSMSLASRRIFLCAAQGEEHLSLARESTKWLRGHREQIVVRMSESPRTCPLERNGPHPRRGNQLGRERCSLHSPHHVRRDLWQ